MRANRSPCRRSPGKRASSQDHRGDGFRVSGGAKYLPRMKPQPMVVPFWSAEEVEAAINGTLAHLAAGKVLAYPTETVYGFGGAVDEKSVQALIDLKGRAPGKPFLVLVSGGEMISRLGLHFGSYASSLAARFWPGPLTLVLPGGERRVPPRLRGPEGG